MSKELFISSSPHETKVAVFEDDLLVEVYYERDTDVGLVGGIYKGRVNRVLPGMQSAFVDIGLERDAFLYVSDFVLEDQEEYDQVLEEAEARVARMVQEAPPASEAKRAEPAVQAGEGEARSTPTAAASVSETTGPPPMEAPSAAHPAGPETAEGRTPSPLGAAQESPRPLGEPAAHRRPDDRGRRRRRRGRGFVERKFYRGPEATAPRTFEILPGESLAKYSRTTRETTPSPAEPATGANTPTAGLNPPAVHEAPTVEAHSATAEFAAGWTEETGAGGRRTSVSEAQGSDMASYPGPRVPGPQEPAGVGSVEGPFLTSPGDASLREFPASTEPVAPAFVPDQAAAHARPEQGAERTAAPEGREALAAEAHTGEPVPAGELDAVPSAPEAPVSESAARQTQGTSETGEVLRGIANDNSATPAGHTYTLREPDRTPHYAPRRAHRGRRGRHQRFGGRVDRARPGSAPLPQISQLLKEGQEILVQIAKEPLGTKGARITSHLALPGRYIVFMPTIDHIGVSRKIVSEQERLRLRNIILENKGTLSGGLIVRTAGEGRSEEEIKADLKFLATLWADIKARVERAKAPALIHRDLDLVQRILRDTLTPDFKSVRVDSETEYERVLDFVSRCQPSLASHVKLYTRPTPLFEEFGIQAEVEKALKPKVWLKSGGYIVINQTEALVAIDVNTGKYVGKTNRLEDTILRTNIDAVNEIVRQMRLRDLGGIIVIDFIDMDERRNRVKVIQALEEALRHDRAPTKVTAFHDFGLVAITRKRVKHSLERTLCEPCNYCSGSGWVKSPLTVCYEILAEAKKMAKQIEGDLVTLRTNPEVAQALKSRDGVLISELEAIMHKDVIIKGDPTFHQERFEIS